MFDDLVKSSMFPAILELLRAADRSLTDVRARLVEVQKGPDHINAMIAGAEISSLDCWRPALSDIMKAIDTSHQNVHGTPLPRPPGAGGGH